MRPLQTYQKFAIFPLSFSTVNKRDAAHGSVPFVLFAPHGANSTLFIIYYLLSII